MTPRKLGEGKPPFAIKKYGWSYIYSTSDNGDSLGGQHICNFSFSHDPDTVQTKDIQSVRLQFASLPSMRNALNDDLLQPKPA